MLWLLVEAPFAAFRTFTAGSFRPTALFIPPSAAYGLLLNLAGIEMRRVARASPMTLIGRELPAVEIALGALAEPRVHSLYQQVHNYPVGGSGAAHAPACKGSKYNISLARRAFLSRLRACIGLRGDGRLAALVRDGLAGRCGDRYGLPFLGENNFLPSRIEVLDRPRPARWLVPVTAGERLPPGLEPMRLTITIDRADMSRTAARLFRWTCEESDQVPDAAWTAVAYT